jgi:NADPH:quinone reductase-like Zn-dependent oxidoreductase
MPTNLAAWIDGPGKPVRVEEAPMPQTEADEVLIRSHAVAMNPVDGAIFKTGLIIQNWPAVIGEDVAGIVEAVGSAVTRFKPGDRVLACLDLEAKRSNLGCFQEYCCSPEVLTAKLPDNVNFVDGCVLPLGLTTAACSLFQSGNNELPLPNVNPKPNGKVFTVWGGSSSVGSCAIQLAKAAGFEVATTCSSHNVQYCKDLGADHVFEYTKDTIVDDVVKALKGKESAGVFDAVMPADTIIKSAEIAHRLGGKKHVATVMVGMGPQVVPDGLPEDVTTSYCMPGSHCLICV